MSSSTPQLHHQSTPQADESSNTNNTTNISEEDANDTLLCLNFNQDGGCLAVGTAHGFRICNTVPFQETFRRTFVHHNNQVAASANSNNSNEQKEQLNRNQNNTEVRKKQEGDHHFLKDDDNNKESRNTEHKNNPKSSNPPSPPSEIPSTRGGGGGGIGYIEMLFRCNLLALVGGGNTPQYQKNKVLIWDDHLKRPIGELSFRHQVLSVKLRRDRICIALRDRVYVYNFGSLALLDTIVTGNNPLGLLCISTNAGGGGGGLGGGGGGGLMTHNNNGAYGAGEDESSGMVLACPSVQTGQARVELYGRRKTLLIDAHESALAAMALSMDGKYLATASERGTIIRLFSTYDSSSSSNADDASANLPLREFRRGVEQAKIESLCFSLDQCWLACASDRGTVHVFQIDEEENNDHNRYDNIGGRNGSGSNSKLRTKSSSKKLSSSSFTSSLAKKVLPNILRSPRKYLLEGENSYVQVRGVTYPKKCAFVSPYTLAIAGLDDCGNGCLLIASFGPIDEQHANSSSLSSSMSSSVTKGEARRIAYHRFFKRVKYDRHSHHHHQHHSHNDPELNGEQLKVSSIKNEYQHGQNDGDEGMIKKIEEISFGDDADGFVSITADHGGTNNSTEIINNVNITTSSAGRDDESILAPAVAETGEEEENGLEKKYSQ